LDGRERRVVSHYWLGQALQRERADFFERYGLLDRDRYSLSDKDLSILGLSAKARGRSPDRYESGPTEHAAALPWRKRFRLQRGSWSGPLPPRPGSPPVEPGPASSPHPRLPPARHIDDHRGGSRLTSEQCIGWSVTTGISHR